jgi:tRNA G10  N-methylase Trm11
MNMLYPLLMTHFLVFGNHPRLALAEYRALRPSLMPAPRLMAHAAVAEDPDWNGADLMERLGGTVKLGEVVLTCDVTDLTPERLADLCAAKPRGEDVAFGFSVIGGTPGVRRTLEKHPLHLKRAFKARGVRSRWVTSKESPSLTPAAVAKLKLTTHGYDLVLLADGKTVHVGLTTHVQNADAWSLRDYGRPARDDENGMLPPKLARIMTNLASVQKGSTALDPFCGSGTVLMEAALATPAAHILGSDLEARHVTASQQNTDWLVAQHVLTERDRERIRAFPSDVRRIGDHIPHASVDAVVTEGDLGPLLRGSESQKQLDHNKNAIEALWKDTLTALHPVLTPHARIVACWPSFKTAHGLARVKLDDALPKLGYRLINPLAGWDETNAPLVYHREGQKIARRIVVLERL